MSPDLFVSFFFPVYRYNPAGHFVHEAAKVLSEEFEKDFLKVCCRTEKSVQKITDHSCSLCQGQQCELCGEKCGRLEPPVLICQGSCYQRIRKGTQYYISTDSTRIYCQRYGWFNFSVSFNPAFSLECFTIKAADPLSLTLLRI